MARNEDDELTLVMLAIGSIGAIIAFVTAMVTTAWTKTLDWLLEHHVLVSPASSPLITVPHGDGAGLDGQRCFIAAGVLLAVGYGAVDALRRRWARGRELA